MSVGRWWWLVIVLAGLQHSSTVEQGPTLHWWIRYGPLDRSKRQFPAADPATQPVVARAPPQSGLPKELTNIKWGRYISGVQGKLTLPAEFKARRSYYLGFGRTDVTHQACRTPTGQSGHCRFLQYCSRSDILASLVTFLIQACPIGENYLGVCCDAEKTLTTAKPATTWKLAPKPTVPTQRFTTSSSATKQWSSTPKAALAVVVRKPVVPKTTTKKPKTASKSTMVPPPAKKSTKQPVTERPLLFQWVITKSTTENPKTTGKPLKPVGFSTERPPRTSATATDLVTVKPKTNKPSTVKKPISNQKPTELHPATTVNPVVHKKTKVPTSTTRKPKTIKGATKKPTTTTNSPRKPTEKPSKPTTTRSPTKKVDVNHRRRTKKPTTTESELVRDQTTKESVTSQENRRVGLGTTKPLNNSTDTPETKKRLRCGERDESISARIVGGNPADKGEWPWMAALLRDGSDQFCGGVLITDQHVLTAAHCVDKLAVKEITVRLGEYDLGEKSAVERDFQVARMFMHEAFERRAYTNDIALLTLKTKVVFGSHIRPICLPLSHIDLENRTTSVTGWGTTSFRGASSKILLEFTVPVWKQSECRAAYAQPITDRQLCAGFKSGGKDSCKGDSGGPLMYEMAPDRWVTVGIVSWGIRCAHPGKPGIYTRVTSYLDWVKDKVRFG